MNSYEKLAIDIIHGETDGEIHFDDVRKFLKSLGFEEFVKGNHFIFTKDSIAEILNLQPKDSKVKIYQLRQISRLLQGQMPSGRSSHHE